MKNLIIKNNNGIFRILDDKDDKYLLVNCTKLRMPFWVVKNELNNYEIINEDELLKILNISICNYDELSNDDKKITNERFGSISIIINSIGDSKVRSKLIKLCSNTYKLTIEAIR